MTGSQLDDEVERFHNRALKGSNPYVWLDTTYLKARQNGQVVSVAVMIAIGVKAGTGKREVLGLDRGPARVGLHSGSHSTCDVGDGRSLVIRINDIGSTSARFAPRPTTRGPRARLTVAMPQAEYA
jgi:Transposase, Mutator family